MESSSMKLKIIFYFIIVIITRLSIAMENAVYTIRCKSRAMFVRRSTGWSLKNWESIDYISK